MIKFIQTSMTPSIREWQNMPGYMPQMVDAFRFIGSLNMLLAGIVVYPSNREQLNSFFDATNENHTWLKDVFQKASRMLIHVYHESEDRISVDVRFYFREDKNHFAKICTVFDDDGPTHTSRWSRDIAA